jgi:flavin reductase (DIM6/NTAB) family NADH-FMN oxidoreductase RutF
LKEEEISAKLKDFMRLLAQPVTVVTTETGGRRIGITVSTFNSVSMKPPLICIIISKSAPSHDDLIRRKSFVVNLLSVGQEFLAERFAGMHGVEDKFDGISIESDSRGLPKLSGCAGYLYCGIYNSYSAGDHTIILAMPYEIDIRGKSDPLIFFGRQFFRVVDKSVILLPSDYMVG